jgi:hypothetical protein
MRLPPLKRRPPPITLASTLGQRSAFVNPYRARASSMRSTAILRSLFSRRAVLMSAWSCGSSKTTHQGVLARVSASATGSSRQVGGTGSGGRL